MTMVLQGESQRAAARPLFGAWEETLIESCLDGSMGEVLAGGVAPVRAAVARLGDFAFLAGDAQDPAAEALARGLLAGAAHPYLLAVPQDERWAALVRRVHPGRWRRVARALRRWPKACPRTRRCSAWGRRRSCAPARRSGRAT